LLFPDSVPPQISLEAEKRLLERDPRGLRPNWALEVVDSLLACGAGVVVLALTGLMVREIRELR